MTGQHYNSGTDDGSSLRVARRELGYLFGMLKAGQSVLITGGRKLGKTVLLQQVKRYYELQDNNAATVAVPLYQDLMSLTRPPTAARLFGALSHKVPFGVNALFERRAVDAKCPPAPDAWRNDPSLEFTHYLNEVLNYLDETVGRIIFIYLLDECEALLGAEETHTLLGNLRALVGPETDNRIKLVVTGFRDIKEYEDPVTGTSPFKNVLLPLPLTLLQEDEFDELIRPLMESLANENRGLLREQLWRATGGHPCLVQTLCNMLTTEFPPERFDDACSKATKLLEGMAFSSWLNRFKPDDHELFRRVLKGKDVRDENPLSVEFLQYCGVLTISNEKLLAPCGLFNNWYELQLKAGKRQASERIAGSNWVMNLSSQGDVASKAGDALSSARSSERNLRNTSYALVMKGGGVKGLAYIGALKELEKYYSFDWFVGTSAGAIAAVLLAVGYTTDDLENILSGKNFKEFLDSSLARLPANLIFKGGFYEARSFTTWLDELIAAKIESFEPVQLMELPRRVTVYASRRHRSALIFDKHGPNSDKAASFAVRCSMSIPFVFTPQRDQGLRVLDGGMQNNYPVGELLKKNPGTEFIGLYLGNYYEGMPRESWLISDMLSIWTEAVDVEALKEYKDRTVVIDPRPIKTIDFNLSPKEKEFLLSVGRAAALRFLLKRGVQKGPTEAQVREAEEKARSLKAEVEAIRRKRRKMRWIKTSVLILLILALGIGYYLLSDKK
jgi:predicted acylesterase/phospholipase RssA